MEFRIVQYLIGFLVPGQCFFHIAHTAGSKLIANAKILHSWSISLLCRLHKQFKGFLFIFLENDTFGIEVAQIILTACMSAIGTLEVTIGCFLKVLLYASSMFIGQAQCPESIRTSLIGGAIGWLAGYIMSIDR